MEVYGNVVKRGSWNTRMTLSCQRASWSGCFWRQARDVHGFSCCLVWQNQQSLKWKFQKSKAMLEYPGMLKPLTNERLQHLKFCQKRMTSLQQPGDMMSITCGMSTSWLEPGKGSAIHCCYCWRKVTFQVLKKKYFTYSNIKFWKFRSAHVTLIATLSIC